MEPSKRVLQLVEKAEKKVGGLRALSRAIDFNPANLSNAKKLKRTVPPWVVGRIAGVIGEDETLATIETYAEVTDGAELDFWRDLIEKRRRELAGKT